VTPDELDRYLTVARKHGATLFRLGDVQVNLNGIPEPVGVLPVPFVPGGLPDPPSLPAPADPDPVKRWDQVDAALWPDGSQA